MEKQFHKPTYLAKYLSVVLLKFMPKSRFENYLSGQILNCELITPCFTQYIGMLKYLSIPKITYSFILDRHVSRLVDRNLEIIC